jgi:hypothetical protein
LLLLRVVPGAAVIIEGIFYFTRADSVLASWLSGCLALAAGALLLAGFLTPIAAAVLAAGTAAVGFSLLPASSPSFLVPERLWYLRSPCLSRLPDSGQAPSLWTHAFSADAKSSFRLTTNSSPQHRH